ncbi:MAG: carbohydrate ABC transporter permease [Clostridia bacterium]|nr:carbohydrate ABC transporter permease [Clostridia bacterium]
METTEVMTEEMIDVESAIEAVETIEAPVPKKKKKKRRKRGDGNLLHEHKGADKPLFIIVFTIFLFHSLTLMIPVIWLLINTFHSTYSHALTAQANGAFSLPLTPFEYKEMMKIVSGVESYIDGAAGWKFSNYIDSFFGLSVRVGGKNVNLLGMLWNSVWYTAWASVLSSVMPAITGYVMSKYRFKGREFIYSVAIFTMTVPIIGTTGAGIKLARLVGYYDSPIYPIITGLGAGWGGTFLVYYGFFKSVAWAYAEAAQIDGAGPFTIFFKIMFPQALPIMGTYLITTSIDNWNLYEGILLFMPSYPTLSSGLYKFQQTSLLHPTLYYTGLIVASIPTIAIFAIFSDKIMTSLSVGGLKG